jgi:hypothetical protein
MKRQQALMPNVDTAAVKPPVFDGRLAYANKPAVPVPSPYSRLKPLPHRGLKRRPPREQL